jgi:predicted dehydrogenase
MTTPLRIGIVGAGAIATLGHIPGFQKLPDVQITAICDTNLERARMVAARFGIPNVYEDYREMLAKAELDAISVGVPNAFHAPITLAALEAGKHVLCEKPLATSVADGRAMVEAAERAGRVLAVNMHSRLRADMTVLRAMIAQGRLGKIGYTSARWFRRSGIPGFGSWFTQRQLSGGGVLMDIGVHMLDLALWLLGFPRVTAVRGEIQAIHGPRGRGLGGWGVDHIPGGTFDVEDFAATHLRLADGGLVTIEVSWAVHGRDEMRVQLFGDEGGADAFPDLFGTSTPLRLFRDEGGTPVDIIPSLPRFTGSEWDRSMARFVAAIREGAEPTATGQEALRVLELLDATYRSALEGREIVI